MDKNVYNMKLEKLQKQALRGDYATAAKICDTIDWGQIHEMRTLTLVSSIYENVGRYDEAMDMLLMAYEDAKTGRRFLYKLTELALAAGKIAEAEDYYKGFIREAPQDADRYLLRYQLADAKGEPLDKRIVILETYRSQEIEEKWLYCLAKLYQKAGRTEDCIALCDELILWFGVGEYVEKAMELKESYVPLTISQQRQRENKAFYEENLARLARGEEVRSLSSLQNQEKKEGRENAAEELPVIQIAEDEISEELAARVNEENQKEAFVTEESTESILDDETLGDTTEISVELADGAKTEKDAEVALEEELPVIVIAEEDAEETPEEMTEEEELPEIEPEEEEAEDTSEEMPEQEELPLIVIEEDEQDVLAGKAEAEEVVSWEKIEEHLLWVELATGEEAVLRGVDSLRKAHGSRGESLAPVAKISANKLNDRGLVGSLSPLQGKDLIIENAGFLAEEMIKEIQLTLGELAPEKYIVLAGCQAELYRLRGRIQKLREPEPEEQEEIPQIRLEISEEEEFAQKEKGETEGSTSSEKAALTKEEFISCLFEYVAKIDCVVDKEANAVIEEMVDKLCQENKELIQALAIEIVEAAADRAEKKWGNLFHSRYNKEGELILRGKHFR